MLRCLIINPNTSQHMTDALKPVIDRLGQHQTVRFTFFTSPTPGIPSINSPEDANESAKICLPHLIPMLPKHDVFLVACYSQHPLVPQLKHEIEKLTAPSFPKYVTGIFEASVEASLLLCQNSSKSGFGIVSTGKIWETALKKAADEHDNPKAKDHFLGCETTGLNASELHDLPPEQVNNKMKEATKKVIGNATRKGWDVRAICLGCAGMVGLEQAVKEAVKEELDEDKALDVMIVDGVIAGVKELVEKGNLGRQQMMIKDNQLYVQLEHESN